MNIEKFTIKQINYMQMQSIFPNVNFKEVKGSEKCEYLQTQLQFPLLNNYKAQVESSNNLESQKDLQ